MTLARGEIVNQTEIGVYHCVSRCVRRAFLCGLDPYVGKSFEHRREWVRSRLSILIDVFAIEVISYAIMNNHLHSLLRTRPDISQEWSDEEVARRWITLFPRRRKKGEQEQSEALRIEAILAQPKEVARYRKRLSSISWFNGCLNEHIARRANKEDDCKGRFWEGRFKCQRVFDTAGIVACSSYIDLNPVRAGKATALEDSDYTSIQDRIATLTEKTHENHSKNATIPLVPIPDATAGSLTLVEYIKLVDETGRLIVKGKASISNELLPILDRLNISSNHWVETTLSFSKLFRRVVGPPQRIEEAAKAVDKNWFHGLSSAKIAFKRTHQQPETFVA